MIKRIEESKSWQLARQLNSDIYKIIYRESFNLDRPLRDQMNRSAGSIMDNIAEGFGRDGNKEFSQFLSLSKGSCVELKSQLYRAIDRNHICKDDFDVLYDKTDHVEKMNSKLISHFKNSEIKGWKY